MSERPSTLVVATAGHVDHGKSSLVRALTGTDPDRLQEEKQRGLTIDLGFAHYELPSGSIASFIDVPGHTRFLRNMLAGVGAVDCCLFVVAATEGWKPQSEEHLRILELLGVSHGVVALTKVDAVDDETREIAALEVADHVSGSFLEHAEVVAVSAATGFGLDTLSAAIDRMRARSDAPADRGRPRLWVDRVFAARGSGTIVTGTLTGGHLEHGEHIEVMTAHGVREARLRSMQTLGRSIDRIAPGQRVALNLAGIEHHEVHRGDCVLRLAQWRPTLRIDATLRVLPALDHDVSRRGAHVAYFGSGEFAVRVRVLGAQALAPGSEGLVRLHLPRPLALLPGDRFVLRESGRDETVGGGEVLDVAPIKPASKATPDRSVDRVIAEHGWIPVDELEAITGERRTATVGRWVAAEGELERAMSVLRQRVDSAGALGIDIAVLDERERAALSAIDDLEVVGGRVRKPSADDPLDRHEFVAAARRGGLTPPAPEGIDRGVLRELVRRGHLVERDGIYFHVEAIAAAAGHARELLADRPQGFTVAEFRDVTGTSRKFSLALLAELDARGMTRRRDDYRIAGPRLDRADAPSG